MWAILSKYFYPLFSPIREDCVLVGEERKLVGPTKISLFFFFFFLFFFFPSSTKQPKTSFLPTFLSFIFHPPYNENVQLNQKKKKKGKPGSIFMWLHPSSQKRKSKKEMWAILSKYFYPLFSPIRGDHVLVEEKRKRVSPTKISYSFPSSTKQPKTSFFPPLFFPSFSILPIIIPTKQSLSSKHILDTIKRKFYKSHTRNAYY